MNATHYFATPGPRAPPANQDEESIAVVWKTTTSYHDVSSTLKNSSGGNTMTSISWLSVMLSMMILISILSQYSLSYDASRTLDSPVDSFWLSAPCKFSFGRWRVYLTLLDWANAYIPWFKKKNWTPRTLDTTVPFDFTPIFDCKIPFICPSHNEWLY